METMQDNVFNLQTIAECPNVPSELLVPERTWDDKAEYDKVARHLAGLFIENFAQYADGVTEEVRAAGPNH